MWQTHSVTHHIYFLFHWWPVGWRSKPGVHQTAPKEEHMLDYLENMIVDTSTAGSWIRTSSIKAKAVTNLKLGTNGFVSYFLGPFAFQPSSSAVTLSWPPFKCFRCYLHSWLYINICTHFKHGYTHALLAYTCMHYKIPVKFWVWAPGLGCSWKDSLPFHGLSNSFFCPVGTLISRSHICWVLDCASGVLFKVLACPSVLDSVFTSSISVS